jgi:pimeloyl-ACP methyl ester carboxylesterase
MERIVKIKAKDGKTIYGTLNRSKRDKELIIFIHGFSGHQNEHIFYNAAQFFPKHGFSTFRFDLYSDGKGARNMLQSTLKTHADDLNEVVSHFKKSYDSISAVGHSFGGPTIMASDNRQFKSIVLWDPSYVAYFLNLCKPTKIPGKYLLDWGTVFLVSKEMLQSGKKFDIQNHVRQVVSPTKIIMAGNTPQSDRGKKYLSNLRSIKKSVVIPRADHCFNAEGTEKKLFKETLKWITKYG